MLTEINCELFKSKKIVFKKGLNVVLGDNEATNSIGKSTLLMVIDFIFGGDTFLEFNKDVFKALGNHDYTFCFNFNDENFRFNRNTYIADQVHICNIKYEIIKSISIEEYRKFLQEKYSIQYPDISFRSIVSVYSRIWGKSNYDVKYPLHMFPKQRNEDAILNLIKLFNKYSPIKEAWQKLKNEMESRKILNSAFSRKYIPQITKTLYNQNTQRINQIQSELDTIKNNFAKYAINISEIVNKELLDLKIQKDKLIKIKTQYENKLERVKINLSKGKYLKSKQLKKLTTFFPNVNMGKLLEIESFHENLSEILRSEIKKSETELLNNINSINSEIEIIDKKINEFLKDKESPGIVIDRVASLSSKEYAIKEENIFYDKKVNIQLNIKSWKSKLDDEKNQILYSLSTLINEEMKKINTIVHQDKRNAPNLELYDKNYIFEVQDDTGTGKAFVNLLIFDFAIFILSTLPFLIHDSLLFKNIENNSMNNIIRIYSTFEKQVFISIDEINKYSKEAIDILKSNYAIQLDNNNLLYIKAWRS